jgi:hypothetical protein
MDDQPTFTVIACLKRHTWGARCRLRLDADVERQDLRWGHDTLGGPIIIDRSFNRQEGWEVDATLLVRNLKPGDKVPLETVLDALRAAAEQS